MEISAVASSGSDLASTSVSSTPSKKYSCFLLAQTCVGLYFSSQRKQRPLALFSLISWLVRGFEPLVPAGRGLVVWGKGKGPAACTDPPLRFGGLSAYCGEVLNPGAALRGEATDGYGISPVEAETLPVDKRVSS